MKELLQIALDDLSVAMGNDYECVEWTLTRHQDGKEEDRFRFYHNIAGWGKALPDMAEALKSCMGSACNNINFEIARKQEEISKLQQLLKVLESNEKHD